MGEYKKEQPNTIVFRNSSENDIESRTVIVSAGAVVGQAFCELYQRNKIESLSQSALSNYGIAAVRELWKQEKDAILCINDQRFIDFAYRHQDVYNVEVASIEDDNHFLISLKENVDLFSILNTYIDSTPQEVVDALSTGTVLKQILEPDSFLRQSVYIV